MLSRLAWRAGARSRLTTRAATRSMSSIADLPARMEAVFRTVCERDPHEKDFQQAVREVLFSLEPVFARDAKSLNQFKVLLEPERIIQFRVPWVDRKGSERVNRGWRVQYSQALGPFKGGTRFFLHTDISTIKFLAFEQTLTNALVSLPVGGAFGGADFQPAGKTDGDIQRFCQSYITELFRDIGPDVDVLSGGIGCGPREIGYMFGQYKRLSNSFGAGAFTGKGEGWGGSRMQLESPGYGVVYFAQHMLQARGDSIEGKRVCVSGAGRVGIHAVEKLIALGAQPITMSDSKGCVYEPAGFTPELLEEVKDVKFNGGKLEEYAHRSPTATYYKNGKPWGFPCDIALPCAIENDILASHAHELVAGGCQLVVEGASMPSHDDAVKVFRAAGMDYAPAKAASAGGAVVSGLEMAQNAQFMQWTRDQVDEELKTTMRNIYERVATAAASVGHEGDLKVGANVASFQMLADAIRSQGLT